MRYHGFISLMIDYKMNIDEGITNNHIPIYHGPELLNKYQLAQAQFYTYNLDKLFI